MPLTEKKTYSTFANPHCPVINTTVRWSVATSEVFSRHPQLDWRRQIRLVMIFASTPCVLKRLACQSAGITWTKRCSFSRLAAEMAFIKPLLASVRPTAARRRRPCHPWYDGLRSQRTPAEGIATADRRQYGDTAPPSLTVSTLHCHLWPSARGQFNHWHKGLPLNCWFGCVLRRGFNILTDSHVHLISAGVSTINWCLTWLRKTGRDWRC